VDTAIIGLKAMPIVSVLMPTYNSGPYLEGALKSILGQTFQDFELVVIDDGSTDSTLAFLESISDARVKIVRNDRNIGLVSTLLKGLTHCGGRYIARMDHDDISFDDRFFKQVNYLDKHPEIDVLGGAIQFFGDEQPKSVHVFPGGHDEIRAGLLFYCTLAHPALMFRRELVDQGLFQYSDAYRHAEDYHLWSQLLRQAKSANLDDCILMYRLHLKQISSGQSSKQYEVSRQVRKLMLEQAGVPFSDSDLVLHEQIILERDEPSWAYLNSVAEWFYKVEVSNHASGYWGEQALHKTFAMKCAQMLGRLEMKGYSKQASETLTAYIGDSGWQPPSKVRLHMRQLRRLARRFI
jgi:glycosyltransferase involved in cell wall biosynthesis